MKRSLIAAVLAVGVTAATTATASAAVVVTRASITTTGTGLQPSDNCGTGIFSGTDTVTYTSVQTPTDGFQIAGTDTGTARVDWPDGSYTLEGFTDHFSFVATAKTTVMTDAHTDFAYNYSADGVLQSQGKFYATEHSTVTNGVIVRVDFDFNHVHGTFC
jgi:sugar lactone lactonase YvrE